jgi:hypothetical protein
MLKIDGTGNRVERVLKALRAAASNDPRPQGTILVTPVRRQPDPDFLNKLKTGMKESMADRRKK